MNKQVPETDWAHSVAERFDVTASAKNFVSENTKVGIVCPAGDWLT
jgi:hypothetical protein